ncbi:MAG TPA: F0F1 ATP synthase subunit A [Spirillospora sp.]|nr:F0F1 ATP synthase subunit A [Spirillospora sp.]
MVISPDEVIVWQLGPVAINATIAYTWLVMALLVIGSWLVTRRLTAEAHIPRSQNILEVVVILLRDQIREVSAQQPDQFLSFVGTLFLFIAVSNLLSVVPGFQSPTGSLSTTTALAMCVFFAVPIYGIAKQGLWGYLRQYLQPSLFMLPFNIIGEFSRTLALAVRLFGNVMSGSMIGGVLLSIAPLFFPIIMELFGLLTGLIQAYIFAILAMVYIASATQTSQQPTEGDETHG